MTKEDLQQTLAQYAEDKTLLTATVLDNSDTEYRIIFTVLHAGEECVFVNIQGDGETTLDYLELSNGRVREYNRAADFVQQEVITSVMAAWKEQGVVYCNDTIDDVDLGWFLRRVANGEVVGISIDGEVP